jgi:biopolymer transport protein ExbD
MSKRASISDEQGELSEINISPMIDMVFILLIFFIVTTVFVEEPGVEVNREYANKALALPKNSILIAITSSDQIFYGGKDIGVNGIRSIVRKFVTQNPEMLAILQVDRDATSGTVIRCIDEVRLGGAKATISTAKHSR